MTKQDIEVYLQQIEEKLQKYDNPKFDEDINTLKVFLNNNDVDESQLDTIYQLLKILDDAIF
ncbi:MAG: hypothetical protein LUG12_13280 [Erysipelotrichaceae bacterium]|nr:hypothetical protein [Erysipelotrichaceae bacterium]